MPRGSNWTSQAKGVNQANRLVENQMARYKYAEIQKKINNNEIHKIAPTCNISLAALSFSYHLKSDLTCLFFLSRCQIQTGSFDAWNSVAPVTRESLSLSFQLVAVFYTDVIFRLYKKPVRDRVQPRNVGILRKRRGDTHYMNYIRPIRGASYPLKSVATIFAGPFFF